MTCYSAHLDSKQADRTDRLEQIKEQARELVTMPANFSELRLQLLHLLDEHDKLVEGEK